MTIDPVALSQALIRCPSVTPTDGGALAALEAALKPLGFACHRLKFEDPTSPPVDNLYARLGTAAPHFCFAGHTDVVPPGDAAKWKSDPFAADIRDGVLYGRGAADMKSAIAAFAAAVSRHLAKGALKGSISFLITGDEEGPAINGTPKLIEWLKTRGEKIDHCVVGEPTSTARAGDTIKIGRRGSINARIIMHGQQGHVGYPKEAINPIPALAVLVTRLATHTLDEGNPHFDPSTLAFTSVDVGNDTTNVIPAEARAAFNIRFNNQHTPESLTAWIEQQANEVARDYRCTAEISTKTSGIAFMTHPGPFIETIARAVTIVTGTEPNLSTSGGTSDARFIKDICPVAELGLAGMTMHQTNECVPLSEINTLTDIYTALLDAYFTR